MGLHEQKAAVGMQLASCIYPQVAQNMSLSCICNVNNAKCLKQGIGKSQSNNKAINIALKSQHEHGQDVDFGFSCLQMAKSEKQLTIYTVRF